MYIMIRLLGFIFGFIMVCLRLLRPGDARVIAAENVALGKQLISAYFRLVLHWIKLKLANISIMVYHM